MWRGKILNNNKKKRWVEHWNISTQHRALMRTQGSSSRKATHVLCVWTSAAWLSGQRNTTCLPNLAPASQPCSFALSDHSPATYMLEVIHLWLAVSFALHSGISRQIPWGRVLFTYFIFFEQLFQKQFTYWAFFSYFSSTKNASR